MSRATSSLAGKGGGTEQGPDESLAVPEQLAAAAVAAVDAAVAAPLSPPAAIEVSEDDASALPSLVVSFAEMGATTTVASDAPEEVSGDIASSSSDDEALERVIAAAERLRIRGLL
ncbi:unnamed protein product [Symbiodinium sp. CCMP2592]|nr:unnamed protein product [Symbiodinium sp. CCMP2592]